MTMANQSASQPVNQIQHHLNNFMVLLLLTKSSHPHLVMTGDGWLFGCHTTPTPTKSFPCGRERILKFENDISNCYNPVFKRLLSPKHIFLCFAIQFEIIYNQIWPGKLSLLSLVVTLTPLPYYSPSFSLILFALC